MANTLQLVRDIYALGKPRIIMLLAITCLAGYLVATKGNVELFNFWQCLLTVFGLCCSAAGANSVNMWWDRDIDIIMTRTKTRPIPAGRLTPAFVLSWGIFLGLFSFALLWFAVHPWAAVMSAAGYLFYVFIYTMGLKRRTVQNIVIGGAAGAFPPLVGWAAVQGNVADPIPWAMFAIIFLWTPPHFWALALLANKDYTKAGIPMLPVVKGVAETKSQILYYLALLVPVTLAVGLFHPFGYLYTIVAAIAGAWWLNLSWHLLKDGKRDEINPTLSRKNFAFSITYLAIIFAAMVVDTFL